MSLEYESQFVNEVDFAMDKANRESRADELWVPSWYVIKLYLTYLFGFYPKNNAPFGDYLNS